MAGLVSPKPISYLQQTNAQYPNYGRNHQGFTETPPHSTIPHQIPQFTPGPGPTSSVREDGKIYGLVIELLDPNLRESALLELSKKREQYDDLALVLWHSFGEFVCTTGGFIGVANGLCRNHARFVARNRLCLSFAISS